MEVELAIGDGLVMNCNIEIESRISLEESQKDYTTILKMFLKQLFEAKEAQIDK